MSCVAPSASAISARDRLAQACVSASVSSARPTRTPLAPDAISTTVSEVDMQPSESIRSKVSPVAAREVHIDIDLHAGDASATVWTNDLTHDYVHENSAYST